MKKNKRNAGKIHPRNKLNNLTGKQWLKFTRSWFVFNPPPRNINEILHPAKFPEKMIDEFIEFFTKRDEWVLDPFLGVGSTLRACENTKRNGIGIELIGKYANIARDNLKMTKNRQIILKGDIRDIDDIWRKNQKKYALPKKVNFIITSPPYWNMLRKSRGHITSTHKERIKKGLDIFYSKDRKDFGNIKDYGTFLKVLSISLLKLYKYLEKKRYLVVIIQNFRDKTGEMRALAWNLTEKLRQKYVFKGEKIWCQADKKLGIWGYPSEFVSNVHHHYCLIFKKEKKKNGRKRQR